MESLALLIPIVAMAIPIVAVYMSGKQKIARMNLEEARLRLQGGGEGVGEELDELREELGHLRNEVGKIQERLDFTERLLAQARPRDGLAPGADAG